MIENYQTIHKSHCMEIFKSNYDLYFAKDEFKQFSTFLDTDAKKTPYFVLKDNDEIAGCGGFVKEKNGKIYLTWGMVKRGLHGQGFGKMLVKHRLDKIRETYGNEDVFIDTFHYPTKDLVSAKFK